MKFMPRRCVAKLQSCGLKVLGDCVLNHRCASHQDAAGLWNQYGGRLDWDARAIVRDDHNFGGRGGSLYPFHSWRLMYCALTCRAAPPAWCSGGTLLVLLFSHRSISTRTEAPCHPCSVQYIV